MSKSLQSDSSGNVQDADQTIHLVCKNMLKSKVFEGCYKDRCYVELVGGYRDVVVLNNKENDLRVFLDYVHKEMWQLYGKQSVPAWIGITKSEPNSDGHTETSVWVELDKLPFGHYTFTIKTVRFRQNEVILKLKPLGHLNSDTSNSQSAQDADDTTKTFEDFKQIIFNWAASVKLTMYECMTTAISRDNINGLFRLLASVVMLSAFLAANILQFLGIFTIRFTAELRKLIVALTPLLLRMIDLFGKVIGGFFLLLAMIWRDWRHKPPPRPPYYQQQYLPVRRTYDFIER